MLDQKPAALPEVLTARVGQPFDLPRAGLETERRRYGLDAFIPTLGSPVSRANDNGPAAPLARYFIIHGRPLGTVSKLGPSFRSS